MADDGPQIQAIDKVPHLSILIIAIALGLTAFLVVLLAATCLCYRRYRQAERKRNGNGPDQPLAFHTHRRPTAVKSPAGSGTHYLKKSPSPTGGLNNGGSGNGDGGMVKSPSGISGHNTPSPTNCMGPGPLEAGVTAERMLEPPGTVNSNRDVFTSETDLVPTKDELETNEKNAQQNGNYLGQLVFKLRYKNDKNALIVSVVRCRDLPAKDPNVGSSDPYVKLQLLPDKQHKVKTRVLRKTRNPVYDEDFTFYGIAFNQLAGITLHFVVLSFDRYSRDDIIGEIFCALNGVDIAQAENQQMALCREIQSRNLKIRSQGRGELLLSLCWQPAAHRLTVVVLKARNLPKMDVTGLADPYVKIYLLCNGQRVAKKKTHVKKRTLSPVYNESFVFDVPLQQAQGQTGGSDGQGDGGGNGGGVSKTSSAAAGLEGVSLEFMLLDWDRVTKNEVIGRLDLGGTKCTGTALHHWNEVCNSPRRQIADWHKLRE